MSLSETRFGANAPGLPTGTTLPPLSAALSRRAALFGAVTVAGVTVASTTPAASIANGLGRPATAQSTALSANDARLVAMAAELRTVLADTVALIKDDRRDCEDIPGFAPLESRRMEISDALFEVPPDSVAGLVAVADIAQQLAAENGGAEDQASHGHNLACDVLRLIGGRTDA